MRISLQAEQHITPRRRIEERQIYPEIEGFLSDRPENEPRMQPKQQQDHHGYGQQQAGHVQCRFMIKPRRQVIQRNRHKPDRGKRKIEQTGCPERKGLKQSRRIARTGFRCCHEYRRKQNTEKQGEEAQPVKWRCISEFEESRIFAVVLGERDDGRDQSYQCRHLG